MLEQNVSMINTATLSEMLTSEIIIVPVKQVDQDQKVSIANVQQLGIAESEVTNIVNDIREIY